MLVRHGKWCLTPHEFEGVWGVVPRQERFQVGFGHGTEVAACAVEEWRDHRCCDGTAAYLGPTGAGSLPAGT